MKYTVELTEEQMRVTQCALEEYFRLRMGQDFDFCLDMAGINCDLSKGNPNHEWIFDMMICRRDHLREIMHAFFRVAFESTGHLNEKTGDMMIAECIWDAIRFARGQNRWNAPFHIGKEPTPVIKANPDDGN